MHACCATAPCEGALRDASALHSGLAADADFFRLLVSLQSASRRSIISLCFTLPVHTPSVQAVNLTFVRISPVGGVLSFLGRSYVIV